MKKGIVFLFEKLGKKMIQSTCKTVDDFFCELCPNLQAKNRKNLLRKIEKYLFSNQTCDALLQEIKEDTNVRFTMALDGLKKIVSFYDFRNYQQIDEYFAVQEQKIRGVLFQNLFGASNIEEIAKENLKANNPATTGIRHLN